MGLEDVMLKGKCRVCEVVNVLVELECVILKLEYELFESESCCFAEANLAVLRWIVNLIYRCILCLFVKFGCLFSQI